jgi:hypothetical protein
LELLQVPSPVSLPLVFPQAQPAILVTVQVHQVRARLSAPVPVPFLLLRARVPVLESVQVLALVLAPVPVLVQQVVLPYSDSDLLYRSFF